MTGRVPSVNSAIATESARVLVRTDTPRAGRDFTRASFDVSRETSPLGEDARSRPAGSHSLKRAALRRVRATSDVLGGRGGPVLHAPRVPLGCSGYAAKSHQPLTLHRCDRCELSWGQHAGGRGWPCGIPVCPPRGMHRPSHQLAVRPDSLPPVGCRTGSAEADTRGTVNDTGPGASSQRA